MLVILTFDHADAHYRESFGVEEKMETGGWLDKCLRARPPRTSLHIRDNNLSIVVVRPSKSLKRCSVRRLMASKYVPCLAGES